MITPKAKKHLSAADPKMAKLIANKKLDLSRWKLQENNFRALVSAIIGQQLSTKAARTIRQRFAQALGSENFTHKQILKIQFAKLRNAGLSGNKVKFIKALARAVETKKLNLRMIKTGTDEQVIAELIKHKGIGKWTAEMFLIFSLGRPDVFSLGDLGLRTAILKIYKPKKLDEKTILKIAEKWRPYRSTACLYLWSSLSNAN